LPLLARNRLLFFENISSELTIPMISRSAVYLVNLIRTEIKMRSGLVPSLNISPWKPIVSQLDETGSGCIFLNMPLLLKSRYPPIKKEKGLYVRLLAYRNKTIES
jgi:hypothetical protein